MSEFVVGLRYYLADEIRKLMRERGLNARQLAAAMHWTESRVSRILTAQRSLNWTEAKVLFEYLGLGANETEVLLEIVDRADGRRMFGRYMNLIGDTDVLFYEALLAAPASDHQGGTMIPYLLCPDDVIERYLSMGFPGLDLDEQRQAMSAVLRTTNAALRAGDQRLRITIGEEAIRRATNEHLEFLLDNDWGWEVYVVPLDRGMPPGYLGRYSILRFDSPAPMRLLAHHLPTWHVRAPIVRDEKDIQQLAGLFEELLGDCVPAAQFRAFLRQRLAA